VLGSSASILGYSTRSRSSLKAHGASNVLHPFPESLLRILTKRYPHGRIFNFEEDGSISSSDVDDTPVSDPNPPKQSLVDAKARQTKKLSREAEAAGILAAIPGARSVAWFPLWDSALERWYAGALVWSTIPTGVLSPEEELTYMVKFAHDIASEI